MDLLEIVLWMGAAASVYYSRTSVPHYVVMLDGDVLFYDTDRPPRDQVICNIEYVL